MRKQTKKLLSWVLTGALALGLVGNVNVAKVGADESNVVEIPEFTVALTGAISTTGDAVTIATPGATEVEYTVYGQAGATVDDIFTSTDDWKTNNYMTTNLANPYKSETLDGGMADYLKVEAKKITVNGEEYAFDKLIVNNTTDPLEFGIFNPWNPDIQPENSEPVPVKEGDVVGFTFTVRNATMEEGGSTEKSVIDQELWADKTGVHAYVAYQTSNWDCRNDYAQNPWGEEYSASYVKVGGVEAVPGEVEVQDVLIKGNGEYTVSISGADLSSADTFNFLGVSSDIKNEYYPEVQVTEATIKIDGQAVNAEPVALKKDAEDNYFEYATFLALKNNDEAYGCPLNAEDTPVPEDSIEITFKITGMEKVMQDIEDGSFIDPITGKPINGEEPSGSPSVQPSGSPSVQPSVQPSGQPSTQPSVKPSTVPTKTPATNTPAKKGAKLTSGKLVYKVTKAATAKKAGTLTVASLSKAGKKAGKLSIPATATIKGYKYKVTKLGNNALKGAKAKSVALGKNITAIPKGAFAKCKKLSTLTVKAKLKSVKKGAFKGCKKTIKVKGSTKKNRKANVKKLKKSGYKKFK